MGSARGRDFLTAQGDHGLVEFVLDRNVACTITADNRGVAIGVAHMHVEEEVKDCFFCFDRKILAQNGWAIGDQVRFPNDLDLF